MPLTEDKAEEVLEPTYQRGNVTLGVQNRQRKRKLKELLQIADSNTISGDIWTCIDHYLRDHEIQEEETEKSDQNEAEKSDLKAKRKKATDPEFLGRGDKT